MIPGSVFSLHEKLVLLSKEAWRRYFSAVARNAPNNLDVAGREQGAPSPSQLEVASTSKHPIPDSDGAKDSFPHFKIGCVHTFVFPYRELGSV